LGSNELPSRLGPRRRNPISRSSGSAFQRAALASAGQALVGLRGFTEDQVRNVAPYRFSAPGKPFRRQSGLPFRTADRKPSLATAPLTTSRAPSGHEPEDRRRSRRTDPPSQASFPFSASSAADPVFASLPRPPPSVLSVFHALDGLRPATPLRPCLVPVTLLGFRLQGFAPRRGPYLSRGPTALLPFASDLPRR